MQKTAILLLSHVIDSDIYRHYDRLESQRLPDQDIFFLCDNSDNVFDSRKSGPNYFIFTSELLQELGYPRKTGSRYTAENRDENPHHKNFNFPPGSVELPLLFFYRSNPDYAYYWVIEYDVRFSGSWRDFFSAFAPSDADLLGTTLTRKADIPDWYHWDGLAPNVDGLGPKSHIRGFFPVYRLSRRALDWLDRAYRNGAGGHQECIIPTLLHHAGMVLEDIGGRGEFVRAGNEDRFYRNTPKADDLSPGTFAFRPVMHKPGNEPNKLWHPVKNRQLLQRALRRLTRPFQASGQ